jgi:hypothetical protein
MSYDLTVDHAKKFDSDYITRKEPNIYCSSETLIKDYLLIKSINTPNTLSVVIAAETELAQLRRYFHDTIKYCGLTTQYQSFYKQHIKFRNGSRIYLYDHQFADLALKGLVFKLIYITNSACPNVYFNDTLYDFTGCSHPPTAESFTTSIRNT